MKEKPDPLIEIGRMMFRSLSLNHVRYSYTLPKEYSAYHIRLVMSLPSFALYDRHSNLQPAPPGFILLGPVLLPTFSHTPINPPW